MIPPSTRGTCNSMCLSIKVNVIPYLPEGNPKQVLTDYIEELLNYMDAGNMEGLKETAEKVREVLITIWSKNFGGLVMSGNYGIANQLQLLALDAMDISND